MNVFVVNYEHRFGRTTRVFDNFAKVQAWKDALGKKGWPSVFDITECPHPKDACGDDYFNEASAQGREFFNYEECKVE
jgi:isopentenyldiphosphate isomerase